MPLTETNYTTAIYCSARFCPWKFDYYYLKAVLMEAPVIEGIDNEVLFVVSVFVALVTILLVHLLYKSNRNSNTRQNESHFSSYSDSASSSRPEDVTQENSREGRKSYFADITDVNFVLSSTLD